jgi:hypothetical protein
VRTIDIVGWVELKPSKHGKPDSSLSVEPGPILVAELGPSLVAELEPNLMTESGPIQAVLVQHHSTMNVGTEPGSSGHAGQGLFG